MDLLSFLLNICRHTHIQHILLVPVCWPRANLLWVCPWGREFYAAVASKNCGSLTCLSLPEEFCILIGCSLQLKLRDGYRDAAANHLMLRLAENNLPSNPSCLMLLPCSACFAKPPPPPPPPLTVSSTDIAQKVQHII